MTQDTLLEEYLDYIYIQEGFADVIKKLTSDKIKDVRRALRTKNPEVIKKALTFIPKMNPNQIEKISKKYIKGFDSEQKKIVRKLGSKVKPDVKSFVSTSFVVLHDLRNKLKSDGKDVTKIDKIMKERESFFTKFGDEMADAGMVSFIVALIIIVLFSIISLVTSWPVVVAAVLIALSLLAWGFMQA